MTGPGGDETIKWSEALHQRPVSLQRRPARRPPRLQRECANRHLQRQGKRYEMLNLGGSIDEESDVGKKQPDIKVKGSQLLLKIS